MRLAHIAWCKRSEGHPGGVPLFGHYCAQVLGATEFSWGDHPTKGRVSEPVAAMMLGEHLVSNGRLDEFDAAIADGFWGAGLRQWGRPVVCVAHGTWRAVARAMGSANAEQMAQAQEPEYRRLPTVAVSRATAMELRDLYGVEPAAIIRNAVDTDVFRPMDAPARHRPVAIYPSDAPGKGGAIIAALRTRMPDLEFRMIGAGIGQETQAIAAGDLYVCPSMSEGCSYAGLQALACGLPVVTYPVGMFADMRDGRLDGYEVGETVLTVGRVTPAPTTLAAWEQAIGNVVARDIELGLNARTWAEIHGCLPRWQREWEGFLGGLL